MIRQHFTIKQWDWRVSVFYSVSGYWTDEIMRSLERAGCSGKVLRGAYENLSAGEIDGGLTYSNLDRGETVMVIGKATSSEEFVKSWMHEMGHLKDHIATSCGISPHGEEIQYLGDDIIGKMWEVAHKFVCCECKPKVKRWR